MRYYIYLDKCFIRSLFSIVENVDFDIEVVEYSVRKSSTTNNQFSIAPSNEKICNTGEDSTPLSKEDVQVHLRDESMCKNCISAQAGYGDSSTIETQRRYINIDDITDMKNNNFYHHLIEKLNTENFRDDSRIKVDEGFIRLYDRYDISEKLDEADIKKKGSFFMLNGKYIWYNDELLTGDIELLAQMSCKIKVLGYKMNCLEQDEEIIKAIAMFIE